MKQLIPPRRQYALILVLVAVIVFLLVTGSLSQSGTNHNICVQVQALKGQIEDTLGRAKKVYDKTPPAYYRHHPDELAKAKRQINEELRTFKPTPC